jgi:D-glycero-D-manno-heptose 1,7-bisphosphate phosphatase
MDAAICDHIPCPMPVEWNGAIAFLDRDGVINLGKDGYINSPEELVLLDGSAKSISALRHAGYRIAIVTNQSAISKGLWDDEQLNRIHTALRSMLLEQDGDAHLDLIITCPHSYGDGCKCRKPHPGMLFTASERIRGRSHSIFDWWGDKPNPIHPLDLMVGDRKSDIGAGWAIGARLFKVNADNGLSEVIERINAGEDGDAFKPVN